MGFRRTSDEWSEFVRRHRVELLECGIPEEVFSDRIRFLVFLDHGYDETGWLKSKHDSFHARILTDSQLARLAQFVGSYISDRDGKKVASRWTSDPDHSANQKNPNSN
jgi:hypothetical protein